jgi:hypothetical protein
MLPHLEIHRALSDPSCVLISAFAEAEMEAIRQGTLSPDGMLTMGYSQIKVWVEYVDPAGLGIQLARWAAKNKALQELGGNAPRPSAIASNESASSARDAVSPVYRWVHRAIQEGVVERTNDRSTKEAVFALSPAGRKYAAGG